MTLDLAKLIRSLIQEQGLSPEDAARVAAATYKASQPTSGTSSGRTLSKTSVNSQEFDEEDPEQAKQRWIEEERRDPNGLYNRGSGGGIFGTGEIVFDDYDPAAQARVLDTELRLREFRNQDQMTKLLKELVDSNRRALPAEPVKQQLDGGAGPRRLGRKR